MWMIERLLSCFPPLPRMAAVVHRDPPSAFRHESHGIVNRSDIPGFTETPDLAQGEVLDLVLALIKAEPVHECVGEFVVVATLHPDFRSPVHGIERCFAICPGHAVPRGCLDFGIPPTPALCSQKGQTVSFHWDDHRFAHLAHFVPPNLSRMCLVGIDHTPVLILHLPSRVHGSDRSVKPPIPGAIRADACATCADSAGIQRGGRHRGSSAEIPDAARSAFRTEVCHHIRYAS